MDREVIYYYPTTLRAAKYYLTSSECAVYNALTLVVSVEGSMKGYGHFIFLEFEFEYFPEISLPVSVVIMELR